ncbi:hypothetical protein D9619_001719 [Psilocybe cf. subviscida]|uniref:Rhodanese domain-containing protein n=1 Tax=Psilocybe cf. subviscida TaxID=2480587 RepID=A0A8H5BI10_9AGAR|nr:hypothetical protein D9619_001719 [Psilocybe cf. subviscida]
MLRTSIIHAARSALRPATAPSNASTILRLAAARFNSTSTPNPNAASAAPAKKPKTPEELARKAALKHQDDLQRDWDARWILYEDFLVKTQNPTPGAGPCTSLLFLFRLCYLRNISLTNLHIHDQQGSYIIDVREPDEVIQGMIPSAVNLPLSVLAGALHLPHKEFAQKYGFEKPRLDQEVVFYCRSGKRSTTACDVAKRNGYTNILNYKGSWLDWVARQNEKTTEA